MQLANLTIGNVGVRFLARNVVCDRHLQLGFSDRTFLHNNKRAIREGAIESDSTDEDCFEHQARFSGNQVRLDGVSIHVERHAHVHAVLTHAISLLTLIQPYR